MTSKNVYQPVVMVKDSKKRSCNKFLLLIPLVLLVAVVVGYISYVYWPSEEDSIMSASLRSAVMDDRLPSSLDQFTCSLHKELASGAGNVFYSPFSVAIALSMTLAGARANTRTQLEALLATQGMDDGMLGDSYHALFNAYEADSSLSSANLMYSSNRLGLRKDFQDHLYYNFLAKAKSVDFATHSKEVTTEINEEVKQQTKGKIEDLIGEGVLNALTSLVLVNAVHFKGEWGSQFNASRTKQEDFTALDGTVAPVPMMSQKATYMNAYHADLDARSLSLDYKDSNFSMLIVLPNAPTGLPSLEEKLGGEKSIAALLDGARETKLTVKIPKFKLDFEADLKENLRKLGVTDLITMGVADLSGLAGKPGDMHVSSVVHKAVLEVNEEGAEAAAATAVVMMMRMAPMEPPAFIVNKPFLFFIVDKEKKIPIFGGRFVKPEEATKKLEL